MNKQKLIINQASLTAQKEVNKSTIANSLIFNFN